MGKGMKAGKKKAPSMGGGGSMQQKMAQIQAVQAKMAETQAELEAKELSATAGGGAVCVTVNGAKAVTRVEIKPEVVDPEDVETLQDLILVATNEALRQAEELSQAEMSKITSGLGIPGMM